MTLKRLSWTRRAAIACAGAALIASPAFADEAAEAYVRSILVEANPIFEASDEQARLAGIEALVDRHVEMRRVSLFVLGQYARVITDAQKERYLPVFKKYATLVYRDALANYSGQRLEVTNSVDRSARDFIVNSRVVNAKPGEPFANITIHWRVYRTDDGAQSIFDAGADGVWLAIEQQSQFKSVIANNGGGEVGIDALIAKLEAQIGE